MKEYLGQDTSDEDVTQQIINNIYENSLPLFRRHIESGRVRLTFLDPAEVRMIESVPPIRFLIAEQCSSPVSHFLPHSTISKRVVPLIIHRSFL